MNRETGVDIESAGFSEKRENIDSLGCCTGGPTDVSKVGGSKNALTNHPMTPQKLKSGAVSRSLACPSLHEGREPKG